jgi:curli biogenesis system outer membrane secretion channel CsgG
MKRFIVVFTVFAAAVVSGGCVSGKQPAAKSSAVVTPSAELYSGPRAVIAVSDFEIAADKAGVRVVSGLHAMLVTALLNSGRFSVADSQAKDQPKADITIAVSVAEFEPQASGGTAGIGGGGGIGSGLMGGLLGLTLHKASMALYLRIIDTKKSVIMAQTRVQGQAADMAGGSMAGFSGGWELDPGLAPYANTPMEKAIRICIMEATRYVSQGIPEEYYKN